MNGSDAVPPDRRIETTRSVPHLPSDVFQAIRDFSILARWWGPKGFTNAFHEFDFREGGSWIFTMHSPDGKIFPNESRFVKIVEPSLIVFDHLCAPRFRTIIELNRSDGGCQIAWCMIFENSKTRENVASFAGDGLEQNLDRLTAILNEEPAIKGTNQELR